MKHLWIMSAWISASAWAEGSQNERKTAPLEIQAEWSLPWEEISGIKLFGQDLYTASDSSQDLGIFPWKSSGIPSGRLDAAASPKRSLMLTGEASGKKTKKKAKKTKKSQWEAIAMDKAGLIFLLRETKDTIVVHAANGEYKQTIQLAPFAGRTHKDKGYEGLVLLKDSRFLVALTKPSILIEFGPKGSKANGLKETTVLQDQNFTLRTDETYEALHSWNLSSEPGCEFSDLSLAKDNKVYALLKDCMRIIQLPELSPEGAKVEALASWSLPSSVPHPEGLESLGDEGFLVASDIRSMDTNLFWLRSSAKPPESKSGYGE